MSAQDFLALLAAMADELLRLKQILLAAWIDQALIKFMTEDLCMTSVTDFVDFVDHAKYHTELGECILEALPKLTATRTL